MDRTAPPCSWKRGSWKRGRLSNRIASRPPRSADRFTTAGEFAEALSEPAPRRCAARVAVRRWGAAIGLAALAAAGILLSRTRPAPPTDPNLLAIAPFDVLDPSLQIWHEGLVDILSRDLDGAGPLRTVPQTVGLKRWQRPRRSGVGRELRPPHWCRAGGLRERKESERHRQP